MSRFKITCVCVVIAETAHEAIGDWQQYPLDNVVELTVAEVAASATPEPPKTMAQKVVATTAALVKDAAVQAGIAEKTPICPDHQAAMQKRPSKFPNGKPYWTCPVKLDDGKFCKAKAN